MEKHLIQDFWQQFLKKTGAPANLKYNDCFYFGLSEHLADELLKLVLEGKKKATASSVYCYQLQAIQKPEAGSYSIITNWIGQPKCIIKTTSVLEIPFKEMTYDICKREGEDDSLESWQKNHIKFFTEEGKAIGYEFSWDMPVLFEDFEVVYTAADSPNWI